MVSREEDAEYQLLVSHATAYLYTHSILTIEHTRTHTCIYLYTYIDHTYAQDMVQIGFDFSSSY